MRNKATGRATAAKRKTSASASKKRASFKAKKAAASAATSAKTTRNKKANSCAAKVVGKVNYKTGMLYFVGKDGKVMEKPLKQNC